MAFVNLPILLLGSLSIAIPIVLHMVMRQRPRHQVFPAMRFLQKRMVVNTRRLRLRQWLLLALRCLAFFVLAAALARPSVSSGTFGNWIVTSAFAFFTLVAVGVSLVSFAGAGGRTVAIVAGLLAVVLAACSFYSLGKAMREGGNALLGDRESPVAASIVIDVSHRMAYRFENETRLDRAKRMASWLIRQLPKDSDVGLLESSVGNGVFSVDIGATLNSLETLEVNTLARPLPSAIKAAIELLQRSEKNRRELYVFTDLTEPSWPIAESQELLRILNQYTDLKVYVIDVGVTDPKNTSIGQLTLSNETLANNSPLSINIRLDQTGEGLATGARLMIESADQQAPIIVDDVPQVPETTPRGQRSITLGDDDSQWLQFSLNGLEQGIHHGFAELTTNDGLAIDNKQFFTVRVRDPWPILIVEGPAAYSGFLTEQLAPLPFRESGRARYEFKTIQENSLGTEKLDEFSAVCLLDPTPLATSDWQRIERYVRRGGGLAVFVGRNCRLTKFNSNAALSLLPAEIKGIWRDPDGLYLSPVDYSHPILRPFENFTTPWDVLPVFKHVRIGKLNIGSSVVLNYGNGKPAIVERVLEAGRVLLMTTPISDRDLPDRSPWNLLPIAEDFQPWQFMILSDQLMQYIIQSNSDQLNYVAGEQATVSVDQKANQTRYQLVSPRSDWQDVSATQGALQISFTETLGAYRLYDQAGKSVGGFSANLDENATDLQRIEDDQLNSFLGENRFHLAREQEEIVRDVDQGRIGREFYPFLIVSLVITLALENLLSNRFYRNPS